MSHFQFALSVKCPKCGVTHWCRDENGKCIAPHRERCQTALRISGEVFSPLRTRDQKNEHNSFSSVPY